MAEHHIRLLLCLACKTLEELPDFVGDSNHDDVLLNLVNRHAIKHPEAMNSGQLMRVDSKEWDDPKTRAAIQKTIREGAGGDTGFGAAYYEAKDTLKADAFACWQKHQRTTDCGDYKSKKMLLMPDTSKDRKAEGLDKYESKTYLCMFCPMESIVISNNRKKAGMYK